MLIGQTVALSVVALLFSLMTFAALDVDVRTVWRLLGVSAIWLDVLLFVVAVVN